MTDLYKGSLAQKEVNVKNKSILNPDEVLTAEQKERLETAKKADKPVIIASQTEAEAREGQRAECATDHRRGQPVEDHGVSAQRTTDGVNAR